MSHGHGLAETVKRAGDTTPDISDVQLRGARLTVCSYVERTGLPQEVAVELMEILGIDKARTPVRRMHRAIREFAWMRIKQTRSRTEIPKVHLVDADEPTGSLCGAVVRPSDGWMVDEEGRSEQCQQCGRSNVRGRVRAGHTAEVSASGASGRRSTT